jgi:uncharacterized membrane protein
LWIQSSAIVLFFSLLIVFAGVFTGEPLWLLVGGIPALISIIIGFIAIAVNKRHNRPPRW